MTNHEQKARELAERCAELIVAKIGEVAAGEDVNPLDFVKFTQETILRELNLAKLVEDEAMLSGVLNLERPYPLTEVLAVLIQATEHLLKDHDCDQHGHERFLYAKDEAKLILKKQTAPPSATR